MRRPLKSLSAYSVIFLLIISPTLISGISKQDEIVTTTSIEAPASLTTVVAPAAPEVKKIEVKTMSKAATLVAQAHAIYDSMKLSRAGLNKKAFEYAWRGYQHMRSRGLLRNSNILSIADFSQSSRRKRLYVINVASMQLLINTHVAHGRRSGGEFARSFSNKLESHMSSLGFYLTRNSYWGGHGLALVLDGLERGINDKANQRNIVVHGSNYVGDRFLQYNKFNGRSFGCPAVPAKYTSKVINTIKNGSCLFIYHPSKNYITKSRILNG